MKIIALFVVSIAWIWAAYMFSISVRDVAREWNKPNGFPKWFSIIELFMASVALAGWAYLIIAISMT